MMKARLPNLLCYLLSFSTGFAWLTRSYVQRHDGKQLDSSHLGVADSISDISTTKEMCAFDFLASNVSYCLYKSDLKRDSGFDGSSTGWTSWVDDASVVQLQECLDSIEVSPNQASDTTGLNWTSTDDRTISWMRWMKSTPSPMAIELSPFFRKVVNDTIEIQGFRKNDESYNSTEVLQRMRMHLIVLPSGTELDPPLRAPAGAMVFGKLLFGGVTRYRRIGSRSAKRKAGARTLVSSPGSSTPGWLQYGGPERSYQAVDAGPCAFIELTLTQKGVFLPLVGEEEADVFQMALTQIDWDPSSLFEFISENSSNSTMDETDGQQTKAPLSGKAFVDQLASSIATSIGGLEPEIQTIVRRVLDGRVIEKSGGVDSLTVQSREMKSLIGLGLKPVRGLLLYGPPGCGKTVLAREISTRLNATSKVVAAPELLDKWIGGSEQLIRDLFADAEAELRQCNGDATKSSLHVVAIDEIDAVFRKRSGAEAAGAAEVTRASAVNQILAKLDGVRQLDNVLFVGMTNRKELLDPALLRPGRLEVQIEVPLPDKEGRRDILKIHFDALRRKGRLSIALCRAIDGRYKQEGTTDSQTRLPRKKRMIELPFRQIRDLAADRWTGGFSGADIAGLVRASGSLALARIRREGGGVSDILITLEDVSQALEEVKQ